jgi:hypothetical protein
MRKFYLIVFSLILHVSLLGQTSMSFYHLGDATFQNSGFNPAYSPDAKFFIGLPVISGIHGHFNNKFSYNEGIRKEGDNNLLSIGGVISQLQTNNMLSAHASVNLIHLGYSIPNGPAISVFANERVEGDVLYPKILAEFIWEGNGNKLGDLVDLSDLGISISHFREIGIGVSHTVSPQLRVGARLKMYKGVMNASTPRTMQITTEVDPQTYEWHVETKKAAFQTSGLGIYRGDGDLGRHILAPGNTGFGVDVGFEYNINRYMSFAASIIDLGYISWKTDVETRHFVDTTFTYSGVNINGIQNYQQAVQDSLFNKFRTTKNSDPYKTWIPTKVYGTMTWKYNDNTHFLTSVGARYIHGQMKMLYGGGIRQMFGPFTATINGVKLPQQFFNVGAALAVRGGPVQYYIAADQMVNFSVPDAKAFDFRMGLNIVIGRRGTNGPQSASGATTFDESRLSGDNKGVSTNSFLGNKVKTKRREGIYSVISKQEKRKVPDSVKPSRSSKKSKTKTRTTKKSSQKYPSKRRRH